MSIWSAVDRLVDQTADEAGVHDHALDLWAARRWRTTGRDVPSSFLVHERAAAMATLALPLQLAWIRQVLDGPIILLKGPEVAARYPDPALRPYGDLDLLVPDPDDAQRRLIAAGCEPVSEAAPHHRPGLCCPGWLLHVEIHERPNVPRWTTISTAELFARAIPSVVPVEGIMSVPPADQAILLAAHSWLHEPLWRIGDLVDIAAMTEGLDPTELRVLAERWGMDRVWTITQQAIDAICTGEPPRAGMCRLLGNHLWSVRTRTLAETRMARLVSAFWAPISWNSAREISASLLRSPVTIVNFAIRTTMTPRLERANRS